MRSAALKSEASRNADILSAAGRLPDSHDPIPSHAVDSCRWKYAVKSHGARLERGVPFDL